MPHVWPSTDGKSYQQPLKNRGNVLVIADDITGAAELAGMAHSRGLYTRLLLTPDDASTPMVEPMADMADITVVATDTRSLSESAAVAVTERVTASFASVYAHQHPWVFKKTDSALRGHVVAELKTLMKAMGWRRAVYMPANPSKGRIIKEGIYYIKEAERLVPIAQTSFSHDPEFPAETSLMEERFPQAESAGIIMPSAESEADVNRIVEQYDDGQTLFAGAADLFAACILRDANCTPQRSRLKFQTDATLILCGSTQSRPLHIGLPTSEMPIGIYDGATDASSWLVDAQQKYEAAGGLVLSIGHHHRTGHAAALHLRQMMAAVAAELVRLHPPRHVVIEGGATAFALLNQLEWSALSVEAQWAPGVVSLHTDSGIMVTLKPGSYSWGTLMT